METSYIFAIVHLALLVVYLILFRHVTLKKRLLALYPLGIGLVIQVSKIWSIWDHSPTPLCKPC